MKRVVLLYSFFSLITYFCFAEMPVHTYSIVARDPDTGEMGVAVQSHYFMDMIKERNLNFLHDPRMGDKYFFPEVMGVGFAFFDFDGSSK